MAASVSTRGRPAVKLATDRIPTGAALAEGEDGFVRSVAVVGGTHGNERTGYVCVYGAPCNTVSEQDEVYATGTNGIVVACVCACVRSFMRMHVRVRECVCVCVSG